MKNALRHILSAALVASCLAASADTVETESAWFSVDPANWTESSGAWSSQVDDGAWTRPAGDASVLVAADGNAPAHISLDTGGGTLEYEPASPSEGDKVHNDASLLLVPSTLAPDLEDVADAQGAITLLAEDGALVFLGLADDTWIRLSHASVTPVTNDYTDVRITLDYSGSVPMVSYSIKVGNAYVTLEDENGATAFATPLPAATNVTSVGFSGTGSVGAFSGIDVAITDAPTPEPRDYDIYINLDGKTAGFFLGDDEDYGEGEWLHIRAASARDALVAAAEQKFGAGSISYSVNAWGGYSLDSINGMNGFGKPRSPLTSDQDTFGYGDIYFYPIHWVYENGDWTSEYSLLTYAGESTTLALTFQVTSFEYSPVEHTFADAADTAVYEDLKKTYNWPGWGEPSQPNFAVTNIAVDATATVAAGGTVTLTATVLPLDALNPNVKWTSGDTSIATVTDAGVVTGVAAGTVTLTATTIDGSLTATCQLTVTAAAAGLTDGGVTLPTGSDAITFTSIDLDLATLTFSGSLVGEPAATGTFALCYTTVLGGAEQKANVTVTISGENSATASGIPTGLPALFATGFDTKLGE